MLHAGLEVDEEAAVVVPRIFVVHALLHVDVDAAQGVDDALEGVRVDDDVVVDAHAQEVFDRALAELMSAVGVSGVDLVVAMPLDLHARVARHGKERCLVLLRIDHRDHQGVGAADVVFSLVDAHDHDGRLVLCGQEMLLVRFWLLLVQEARRSEERTRRSGGKKEEYDGDIRPDAPLLFRHGRRRRIFLQDHTFFSAFFISSSSKAASAFYKADVRTGAERKERGTHGAIPRLQGVSPIIKGLVSLRK